MGDVSPLHNVSASLRLPACSKFLDPDHLLDGSRFEHTVVFQNLQSLPLAVASFFERHALGDADLLRVHVLQHAVVHRLVQADRGNHPPLCVSGFCWRGGTLRDPVGSVHDLSIVAVRSLFACELVRLGVLLPLGSSFSQVPRECPPVLVGAFVLLARLLGGGLRRGGRSRCCQPWGRFLRGRWPFRRLLGLSRRRLLGDDSDRNYFSLHATSRGCGISRVPRSSCGLFKEIRIAPQGLLQSSHRPGSMPAARRQEHVVVRLVVLADPDAPDPRALTLVVGDLRTDLPGARHRDFEQRTLPERQHLARVVSAERRKVRGVAVGSRPVLLHEEARVPNQPRPHDVIRRQWFSKSRLDVALQRAGLCLPPPDHGLDRAHAGAVLQTAFGRGDRVARPLLLGRLHESQKSRFAVRPQLDPGDVQPVEEPHHARHLVVARRLAFARQRDRPHAAGVDVSHDQHRREGVRRSEILLEPSKLAIRLHVGVVKNNSGPPDVLPVKRK